MKPFVLNQQLADDDVRDKVNQAPTLQWEYTVPLTLDACRCPHLQTWLPHVLNLECIRTSGGDGWKISNPVHALHLSSQTNDDGTTKKLSESDIQLLYGEEQRRTRALQVGGIADSYLFVGDNISGNDEKSFAGSYSSPKKASKQIREPEKVTNATGSSAESGKTAELTGDTLETIPEKTKSSPSEPTAPVTTTEPTANSETTPDKHISVPLEAAPALSAVEPAHASPQQNDTTIVPKETQSGSKISEQSLSTKDGEKKIKEEPAKAPTGNEGPSPTPEGSSKVDEIKSEEAAAPKETVSSIVETDSAVQLKSEDPATMPLAPTSSNPLEVPSGTETPKPDKDSSGDGIIQSAFNYKDPPAPPDQAEGKGGEPLERPPLVESSKIEPSSLCEESKSAPDPVEYHLPSARYHSLRLAEDRILKQRRALLSKRKQEPSKKKTGSSSSKKQKVIHKGRRLHNDQIEFDLNPKWERTAARARSKVENWMNVVRTNRLLYWEEMQNSREPTYRGDDWFATRGGQEERGSNLRCERSPRKFSLGSTNKRLKMGCGLAAGDELLQCLECSFIGCAPRALFPASKQHILHHLLQTGHTFAISCGARNELYCFKCCRFVYHEIFDQERERIDIACNLPFMGWKEHAIQRSFDPMNFVTTPDFGVVWRGLVATYPSVAAPRLLLAARLSLKRQYIFKGEIGSVSLSWRKESVDLAAHQRLLTRPSWKIRMPVGMYNMGNTCFMSAVMQCLIHCFPLQRHFLRDVGHHHESCQLLRQASNDRWTSNEICLACEMDTLFLRYFGSTIGKDVTGAVRSLPVRNVNDSDLSKKALDLKGEPLVTSDLLWAAWKSGGFNHLAGYEQRDAHEFLQAFLDTMGKHASQHRKRVRLSIHKNRTNESMGTDSDEVDDDVAKNLFEGTLRSVLICGECGCKRSLTEKFLNISLPLAKEMERSETTSGGISTGTRSASTRLKLSVQQCLDHFTASESLGDPVHCSSCNKKTKTKKQHTFAKLPRVLCLHLKRFDASKNKKIEDFVSFPAFGLNMGEYLPHWCEVMQGTTIDDAQPDSQRNTSSPQVLYDLFGTVNHAGNLNQGHYVANVKVGDQWYHCNDAFVCKAGPDNGEKDVLESDGAYVLFYIRRP